MEITLTKQDMFNTMIEKLEKQKRPCRLEGAVVTRCCYHNEIGERCAVGWVLPKSVAERYSNVGNVSELVYNLGMYSQHRELAEFLKENLQFLTDCQVAHDDWKDWQQISVREAFEPVALKYNLGFPEGIA